MNKKNRIWLLLAVLLSGALFSSILVSGVRAGPDSYLNNNSTQSKRFEHAIELTGSYQFEKLEIPKDVEFDELTVILEIRELKGDDLKVFLDVMEVIGMSLRDGSMIGILSPEEASEGLATIRAEIQDGKQVVDTPPELSRYYRDLRFGLKAVMEQDDSVFSPEYLETRLQIIEAVDRGYTLFSNEFKDSVDENDKHKELIASGSRNHNNCTHVTMADPGAQTFTWGLWGSNGWNAFYAEPNGQGDCDIAVTYWPLSNRPKNIHALNAATACVMNLETWVGVTNNNYVIYGVNSVTAFLGCNTNMWVIVNNSYATY